MNRYFPVGIVFAWVSSALAGAESTLPTLSIEKGTEKQQLAIQNLEVTVEGHGYLVEVTHDITYYNGSPRNQEGEFQLELPPGASVSAYSLEVDGKMRPAVSVEKEKALHAYETIKRRGIDPGIVEKVGDNQYRTRIFPILPQSTKRVRISHIRSLPPSVEFELKIRHDAPIGRIRVEVTGTSEKSRDAAAEEQGGSRVIYEEENEAPDEIFTLQSDLPETEKIVSRATHHENRAHFLIQGESARPEAPDELNWPRIRLVWDASRSRDPGQRQAEIQALRLLWKELDEAEISFQVLRNTLTEPRSFRVEQGRSPELERELASILYDGSADFSLVDSSSIPTLLVSDGLIASPLHEPTRQDMSQAFLLTLNDATSSGAFSASQYRVVPMQKHWITHLSRPRTYAVKGIPRHQWSVRESEGLFFLSGECDLEKLPGIKVRIGDQPPRSLKRGEAKEKWSFLDRFHARQRLEELERFGDAAAIASHARKERLASDYTSLIVLEEFRDHVEFEIPPPEPELVPTYEKALAEKSEISLSRIEAKWNRKRKRHAEYFPWIDSELERELKTVSIWLDASRQVFPEKLRNHSEIEPYENWVESARELLAQEETLGSSADIPEWKTRIDRQVESLEKIRNLPLTPVENQEIHFSVRGFVHRRGVFSKRPDFRLGQAIVEAGGVDHYGSLRRVYLYRDASRTGYNLEHPDYEPVPLEWGDMVVVETLPKPAFLSGDPFADPFLGAPRTPSQAPAVFEENAIAGRSEDLHARPFGAPREDSAAKRAEQEARLAPSTGAVRLAHRRRGIDTNSLEDLSQSEEIRREYFDWLQRSTEPLSPAMVVAVSRLLFERNEIELGRQCLDNLIEMSSNPVEAFRVVALWLSDFGRDEQAREVLESLLEHDLDPATRVLIHHDIGRIADSREAFGKSAEIALETADLEGPVTIALVDLFRKGGNLSVGEWIENALPSDLRVVTTSAGGELSLEIQEPPEAEEWGDTGVILTRSPRIGEFMIRRAWPGRYRIHGLQWENETAPFTLRVEIYTNWGRPSQEKRVRTLWIEDRQFDLGEIEFDWE